MLFSIFRGVTVVNKTDKLDLVAAIDKLDALTCWDEDEYMKHYGIKKAKVSKEIRNEIREILEKY